MKRFAVLIVLIIAVMFVGCASGRGDDNQDYDFGGENPKVEMEMEDGGIMVFELYPQYAPETVENFVRLVDTGFYDGLTFHRIIKGFMVQGGDPRGDGTGGSGNPITGEFASNGFTQNTLSHTKGVISMARTPYPNSATSQFFIMDGDITSLDGDYAAFGKLIEGEDTLRAIADTPVGPNRVGEMSVPQRPVVIKRAVLLNAK